MLLETRQDCESTAATNETAQISDRVVVSFLDGQVKSQIIYRDDCQSVFTELADDQARFKRELAVLQIGSEGKKYLISWLANFSAHQLPKIFEKNLAESKAQRLLGWEQYKVHTLLQPLFSKYELQLIVPLGATDESIYNPYIEGSDLFDLFSQVILTADEKEKVQTRKEVQAIVLALRRKITRLHHELTELLLEFFNQKGYVITINSDTAGTARPIVLTRESMQLDFIVDILPFTYGYQQPRMNNWMVPAEGIPAITQDILRHEPRRATQKIIETMICVDPVSIAFYPVQTSASFQKAK